ncbi:MAG TPA: hypothetical protein VGF45_02770 [Polyangia bacterium]
MIISPTEPTTTLPTKPCMPAARQRRVSGQPLGAPSALAIIWVALAACSSNGAAPDAGSGGTSATTGRGGAGVAGAGGTAGSGTGGSGLGGATGAGGASGAIDSAPPRDGSTDVDAKDTASGDASADAQAAIWPTITDYGTRGPYPITRESNTGPGRGYDVFRPAQLGEGGRKHPVISWANGTLFDIPDYLPLLEHWASHGFVVVAAQTNTTAGGGTHKAGIDWIVAENMRAGSLYIGTIDATKIGAAGHSQGGGATIAAGANKPGPTGIVTTIPLMPLLSFESDKTIVAQPAAPMLNINASSDNRDPNGLIPMQIFTGAQSPLLQAAFMGVHEDAMNPAMLRPTLAWFRLHLMNDQAARALFFPAGTCGLCQDRAWREVRHKNTP